MGLKTNTPLLQNLVASRRSHLREGDGEGCGVVHEDYCYLSYLIEYSSNEGVCMVYSYVHVSPAWFYLSSFLCFPLPHLVSSLAILVFAGAAWVV